MAALASGLAPLPRITVEPPSGFAFTIANPPTLPGTGEETRPLDVKLALQTKGVRLSGGLRPDNRRYYITISGRQMTTTAYPRKTRVSLDSFARALTEPETSISVRAEDDGETLILTRHDSSDTIELDEPRLHLVR